MKDVNRVKTTKSLFINYILYSYTHVYICDSYTHRTMYIYKNS